MLTERVKSYIERHSLLKPEGRYLVALSGGADSVALLRVLLSLGYQLEAAHCNFQLRGEESMRDERFVEQLCSCLNIPLHRIHFDTQFYATQHGVSIEMAARSLRYGWFARLCCDIGFDAVCVAHHRDDSVETLLLNLVRGTGIRGLRGILPYTELESPCHTVIVRPLLCVGKKDIEEYLSVLQQAYVTDSSNLQDNVLRNKIRLDVMPLLQELNSKASENMQRTAEHMIAAYDIYASAVKEMKRKMVKDNSFHRNIVTNVEILFELIRDYGFTPGQAQMIYQHMDAPSGRIFSSATHHLLLDRQKVIVREIQPCVQSLIIPEEGIYVFSNNQRLRIQRVAVNEHFQLPQQQDKAYLDADKVRFPLLLRTVQNSDKFIPLGMNHHKLVNRYFIDTKVPLLERRQQLVLEDADKHIVWLVGYRIDHRFRITADSRDALCINMESIKN